MSRAQVMAQGSGSENDGAAGDAESVGSRADPHLDWMEVLETGIEELDAWHRQLVSRCNDLLSASRGEQPWSVVVEKADALARSCIDHFRLEEALMDSNDFPRAEAHREEHRRIAARLWWLADAIRVADGTTYRDRAFAAEFKVLMLDVMVRHDLDYRSHLQNRLGR